MFLTYYQLLGKLSQLPAKIKENFDFSSSFKKNNNNNKKFPLIQPT